MTMNADGTMNPQGMKRDVDLASTRGQAVQGHTPGPWEQRKAKVLARINAERTLFINPRKHALDWQAGLQLVGKGLVTYDGATFRAVA